MTIAPNASDAPARLAHDRSRRAGAAHRLRDQIAHVAELTTGGITAASAPSYLSLRNVGCVSWSWLTPSDALATGDWARISALAAEAGALR